jgi:hypothetical protein
METKDNNARMIGYVAIVVAVVLFALLWFIYATPKVAVTQATSIVTPVTANAVQGVITTFTLNTLAANAEFDFTVNNNKVKADSVVLLTTQYGGAANGMPVVYVRSVSNGSFVVRVRNVGSATLGDFPAKIHFHVFN